MIGSDPLGVTSVVYRDRQQQAVVTVVYRDRQLQAVMDRDR